MRIPSLRCAVTDVMLGRKGGRGRWRAREEADRPGRGEVVSGGRGRCFISCSPRTPTSRTALLSFPPVSRYQHRLAFCRCLAAGLLPGVDIDGHVDPHLLSLADAEHALQECDQELRDLKRLAA